MELDELLALIQIRNYVVNSIALPSIDRKTVSELNGLLLLLDKKIIGLLTSTDFKDYIGYKNVDEAKRAAAQITNIYSGMENPNILTHRNIRQIKKDK